MHAGLIIDAFGELRDQQEQVKEDMEVSEMICDVYCLDVTYVSLKRYFTVFAD